MGGLHAVAAQSLIKEYNMNIKDIKVRAWDCYNNRYIYSTQFASLSGFYATCELLINGQNELIFEDFVGKQDENLNELCEGDICTAEYHCPVCFDDKPHKLTGTIEKSETCLCWMFDYGHGSLPLADDRLSNLKLISNIHKNPELLK